MAKSQVKHSEGLGVRREEWRHLVILLRREFIKPPRLGEEHDPLITQAPLTAKGETHREMQR